MYRSLLECVRDLEAQMELVRVDEPIDPYLEMAEIQRRVFRAGGPAILFTCPKDCRFPMLGNLFGTKKRMRYLFRDTLDSVARLMRLKVDPAEVLAATDQVPHDPTRCMERPAAAREDRAGFGLHHYARSASAVEVVAQ